jgi:hypothetical protein
MGKKYTICINTVSGNVHTVDPLLLSPLLFPLPLLFPSPPFS